MFPLEKDKKEEENIKVTGDFKEYLDRIANKTNRTHTQVLEDYVKSDLPIFIVEETISVGETKLKMIDQLSAKLTGETKPDTPKMINIFRELADTFAPVHAGVQWTVAFTIGGGFEVHVEDPENKVMLRNKDEINRFNANVYMDYYNRGLDRLIYLQFKPTLPDGFYASEIVYEEEMHFLDYAENERTLTNMRGEEYKEYDVDHESIEWRKHKGIQRLKMIPDAVNRLTPIRDTESFEVKYWIMDQHSETETYLLPEQLFITNWNTEGTDLIGKGIVKPVATIALLLYEILKAVGINFKRWGNKRYYLIMGTPEHPFSPTHIANLLKDTKEMVKKNKMAVAAPAGFDYKEIGGETFQGRDIIDTLLGIIASGMGFPKEFLESPRTSASDKSWQAWLVKNAENQRQLKRAVEQQLWEKHLWCKYGKETRLSKKGVPVNDQEHIPQYVPKMYWKRASLQSIAERVKMLISPLNTSNPITPAFKLAIEKELAKMFGLDDIKFPTVEELEAQIEQQMKLKEQAQKRFEGGTHTEIAKTGEGKKPPPKVGSTRVPKAQKPK